MFWIIMSTYLVFYLYFYVDFEEFMGTFGFLICELKLAFLPQLQSKCGKERQPVELALVPVAIVQVKVATTTQLSRFKLHFWTWAGTWVCPDRHTPSGCSRRSVHACMIFRAARPFPAAACVTGLEILIGQIHILIQIQSLLLTLKSKHRASYN